MAAHAGLLTLTQRSAHNLQQPARTRGCKAQLNNVRSSQEASAGRPASAWPEVGGLSPARQAAARGFCERHALPEEVVAPLTEHLAANLERVPGAGEDVRPDPHPFLPEEAVAPLAELAKVS